MKCEKCRRRFNESHREDNGVVYVQKLCICCQGLTRLNRYQSSKEMRPSAPEPVLDTDNRMRY